MSVLTRTALLLIVSNLFMLTAWYLHLKTLNHKPWYIASLVSWCIAFFEYTVHIPAKVKHQLINDSDEWIEHLLVTAETG